MEWLLFYIGDKIDPKQYGGCEGNSITHYLIDFVNFILYNQDLKQPHAILTLMADFSKGFNRQNHNILIVLLSDLGCPGWLLKIIIAYLSDRELVVRYKGQTSDRQKLPGGTGQGTRLGMFLFLILINKAGFPLQEIQYNQGEYMTRALSKRLPMLKFHAKYLDDLTLAESIYLREKLIVNPVPTFEFPLTYHKRTGHILPPQNSHIQKAWNDLQSYVTEHEMKINFSKTKVMLFNRSKRWTLCLLFVAIMGNPWRLWNK